MTNLKEGDFARIVNIEDEPKTIYAQIAALGLFHGMELQVLECSADRISLLANGEELILAPLFAANVHVALLPKEHDVQFAKQTLAELRLGQQGIVTGISRKIRGQQRCRLMDIGIIPGTVITSQMRSPSGDPTAYIIRGASIALRREQARHIYIEDNHGYEE